ncbi:MAG: phosphoribosylanthranilate isomerase [Verrucomicrobiales bacterium]|nr:phosphoribosylanthranilate isomerase [Verrucomicrobiales bacterium]
MNAVRPGFFEPDDSRVKAKICGITTAEQAIAIHELGADALGFNFWLKSKRYLERNAKVDSWLQDLAGKITRIGVFVNPTRPEIESAIGEGVIDFAQLHGDESPEFFTELATAGLPVFKATGVKNGEMLDEAAAWFTGAAENAILLDAYAPVEYGGTGETMDWNLGREAVIRWPEQKVILAGGLNPGNIADAIAQVRPFAVDVASGVESGTPGVKDQEKVRNFLAAVRS